MQACLAVAGLRGNHSACTGLQNTERHYAEHAVPAVHAVHAVHAVYGVLCMVHVKNDVMCITHQPVALRVEVTTHNIVGVSLQRSEAFSSDRIPQLQSFVV